MPRRVVKETASGASTVSVAESDPSYTNVSEVPPTFDGTTTVVPDKQQMAGVPTVGLAATVATNKDGAHVDSATFNTTTAQNLQDVFTQAIHPRATLWTSITNGGAICRDTEALGMCPSDLLAVRHVLGGSKDNHAISPVVFARGWLVECSQKSSDTSIAAEPTYRVLVPHCALVQACEFQNYISCPEGGRQDAQVVVLPAVLHPSLSGLVLSEMEAVVMVIVPGSNITCIIGMDCMGQEMGMSMDLLSTYFARPLEETRCDDKLAVTSNNVEVNRVVSKGWLEPRVGCPWSSRTPNTVLQVMAAIRDRARAVNIIEEDGNTNTAATTQTNLDKISCLQSWATRYLLQPSFQCKTQSISEDGQIEWNTITVPNTPGIPLLANITASSASVSLNLHFNSSPTCFGVELRDEENEEILHSTPSSYHQMIAISVPTSHRINWLKMLSVDRTFSSDVVGALGGKRPRDQTSTLLDGTTDTLGLLGFDTTVLEIVSAVIRASGTLSNVSEDVASALVLEVCRSNFLVNAVSTMLSKPQPNPNTVVMAEVLVTTLLRVMFNYSLASPTQEWIIESPETADDDRPRQPKTLMESMQVTLGAVAQFLSLLFNKQLHPDSILRSETSGGDAKAVTAAFAVKYRNWLELYVRVHQIVEVYRDQQHFNKYGMYREHTLEGAAGSASKNAGTTSIASRRLLNTQRFSPQNSLVCELATMPISSLFSCPSLADIHRIYFPETVALMLEEHEEHVLRAEAGQMNEEEATAANNATKIHGINTSSIAARSLELHPTNFYNFQHALLASVTSHPLYQDDDDSLGNMNDSMFSATLQPPTESAATGSLFLSAAKKQFSAGSKYGASVDAAVASMPSPPDAAPTQVNANPSDVHFGFSSPLVGGGSNALLFDWWVQRLLLRERREWIATEQRRQHIIAIEKVNRSQRGRRKGGSKRSILLSSTKHCRYLTVPTSLQPRTLLHRHQWMKELLLELGIVSPKTLLVTNTVSEELRNENPSLKPTMKKRYGKFDAAATLGHFATEGGSGGGGGVNGKASATDMTHAAPDLALRTLSHYLRSEESRLNRKIRAAERKETQRKRDLEEQGVVAGVSSSVAERDEKDAHSDSCESTTSTNKSHSDNDSDVDKNENDAGELTMPELPPSQLFLPLGSAMIESAHDSVFYLWKSVLGSRRRLFYGFDHAMGPFASRRKVGNMSEAVASMWLREHHDQVSGEVTFIPFYEESPDTISATFSSIPHPLSLNCGDLASATSRFVAAIQEERTQHFLNFTACVGSGLMPTLPSLSQVISGLASTTSAANAFSQLSAVVLNGPIQSASLVQPPLTPLYVECCRSLGGPATSVLVRPFTTMTESSSSAPTLKSAIVPMLLPPLSNTTQAVSTRTDMPSRTPYSDSRLLMFWCVAHWVEGGDRMWLHPLKDPEDLEDLCALAASQHGLQGASSDAAQDLPTALIPKVNTEERVWSLLGTLNTQLSIRTIHFTTGLVTNTSETHLTASPLKVHEYRLSTLQSVSPILAALEVKRLISKHAPDVPLSPSEATVTPLVDVLYRSIPTVNSRLLSKQTQRSNLSSSANSVLAHTTALALLNRAEYGPLCWSGIESLVGMSRVELEASVLSGNMSTSQLLSPTPHLTSHRVFMGALESSNDHKRATLQLLQLLTAGTTLFQHPNMPATLPTVLNNTRLLEGLPGSGRTSILANFAAASIFGDASRLQAGRRAGQTPLLAELRESRSYLSYLFDESSSISVNSFSRLRHAKAVETALGHFRNTCNAQHALLRLHQLDNNPYPTTNNDADETMEKYQKLALRSVPVICVETAAGTLKNSVLALSGTTKYVDNAVAQLPFSGTLPQLMSVGLDKALRSPLLQSPYLSTTTTFSSNNNGVLRLQEIIEFIDTNGGMTGGTPEVVPSDSISALLMSLLPPTVVAELNIQHTVNGMNINESLAELFPGACGLFTRCTALVDLLQSDTNDSRSISSLSEINQHLFAALGRSVGQTEVIAKLLYREALTNAAQYAMRPDGSEIPLQDDAPPPPTYTPDPEEGLQCRVDLSWVVPQPTLAIRPLPSSEVFWGPVRNAHDIRQQLIIFEQASRKSETTSSAAPPPPTTTPTSVFGTDISPLNFIGATIAPVLHSTLGNVITFHDIPADGSSPGHLLDTALNTALARDAEDTSAPIPRRSRSIFTLSAAELAAIDQELLQLCRYVLGKEYINKASSYSAPSSVPSTLPTTSASCISNTMVGLARHHFYGRSLGQQQPDRLTIQPIALDSGTESKTPLQPIAASLFVQGHLAPAYSRYLSAITIGISSTLPFTNCSTQQQDMDHGSDITGLSTSIFTRNSSVPCVVIADDSDMYHVNTFLSLPAPTVFATSSHPAQGLRSMPQADTNLRHKLSDMLSASHKAATGGSLVSTYDTCPSAGNATPWQKSFSEEEVVILKEAERIVKSCEISSQRVDSIVLSECHHDASVTAVEESRRVARINKWKSRMAMLQFANRSALLLRYALRNVYFHGILQGPRTVGNRDVFTSAEGKIPSILSPQPTTQSSALGVLHRQYTHAFQPSRGFHAVIVDLMCSTLPTISNSKKNTADGVDRPLVDAAFMNTTSHQLPQVAAIINHVALRSLRPALVMASAPGGISTMPFSYPSLSVYNPSPAAATDVASATSVILSSRNSSVSTTLSQRRIVATTKLNLNPTNATTTDPTVSKAVLNRLEIFAAEAAGSILQRVSEIRADVTTELGLSPVPVRDEVQSALLRALRHFIILRIQQATRRGTKRESVMKLGRALLSSFIHSNTPSGLNPLLGTIAHPNRGNGKPLANTTHADGASRSGTFPFNGYITDLDSVLHGLGSAIRNGRPNNGYVQKHGGGSVGIPFREIAPSPFIEQLERKLLSIKLFRDQYKPIFIKARGSAAVSAANLLGDGDVVLTPEEIGAYREVAYHLAAQDAHSHLHSYFFRNETNLLSSLSTSSSNHHAPNSAGANGNQYQADDGSSDTMFGLANVSVRVGSTKSEKRTVVTSGHVRTVGGIAAPKQANASSSGADEANSANALDRRRLQQRAMLKAAAAEAQQRRSALSLNTEKSQGGGKSAAKGISAGFDDDDDDEREGGDDAASEHAEEEEEAPAAENVLSLKINPPGICEALRTAFGVCKDVGETAPWSYHLCSLLLDTIEEIGDDVWTTTEEPARSEMDLSMHQFDSTVLCWNCPWSVSGKSGLALQSPEAVQYNHSSLLNASSSHLVKERHLQEILSGSELAIVSEVLPSLLSQKVRKWKDSTEALSNLVSNLHYNNTTPSAAEEEVCSQVTLSRFFTTEVVESLLQASLPMSAAKLAGDVADILVVRPPTAGGSVRIHIGLRVATSASNEGGGLLERLAKYLDTIDNVNTTTTTGSCCETATPDIAVNSKFADLEPVVYVEANCAPGSWIGQSAGLVIVSLDERISSSMTTIQALHTAHNLLQGRAARNTNNGRTVNSSSAAAETGEFGTKGGDAEAEEEEQETRDYESILLGSKASRPRESAQAEINQLEFDVQSDQMKAARVICTYSKTIDAYAVAAGYSNHQKYLFTLQSWLRSVTACALKGVIVINSMPTDKPARGQASLTTTLSAHDRLKTSLGDVATAFNPGGNPLLLSSMLSLPPVAFLGHQGRSSSKAASSSIMGATKLYGIAINSAVTASTLEKELISGFVIHEESHFDAYMNNMHQFQLKLDSLTKRRQVLIDQQQRMRGRNQLQRQTEEEEDDGTWKSLTASAAKSLFEMALKYRTRNPNSKHGLALSNAGVPRVPFAVPRVVSLRDVCPAPSASTYAPALLDYALYVRWLLFEAPGEKLPPAGTTSTKGPGTSFPAITIRSTSTLAHKNEGGGLSIMRVPEDTSEPPSRSLLVDPSMSSSVRAAACMHVVCIDSLASIIDAAQPDEDASLDDDPAAAAASAVHHNANRNVSSAISSLIAAAASGKLIPATARYQQGGEDVSQGLLKLAKELRSICDNQYHLDPFTSLQSVYPSAQKIEYGELQSKLSDSSTITSLAIRLSQLSASPLVVYSEGHGYMDGTYFPLRSEDEVIPPGLIHTGNNNSMHQRWWLNCLSGSQVLPLSLTNKKTGASEQLASLYLAGLVGSLLVEGLSPMVSFPTLPMSCPRHRRTKFALTQQQSSQAPRQAPISRSLLFGSEAVLQNSGSLLRYFKRAGAGSCDMVCLGRFDGCGEKPHLCMSTCHPTTVPHVTDVNALQSANAIVSHSACPFPCQRKQAKCDHKCSKACGVTPCPASCPRKLVAERSCGQWIVSSYTSEPHSPGQVVVDSQTGRKTVTTKDGIIFEFFPHYTKTECGVMSAANEGRSSDLSPCDEPVTVCCKRCSNEIVMRVRCRDVSSMVEILEDADAPHCMVINSCPHCAKVQETLRTRAFTMVAKNELAADMVNAFIAEKTIPAFAIERKKAILRLKTKGLQAASNADVGSLVNADYKQQMERLERWEKIRLELDAESNASNQALTTKWVSEFRQRLVVQKSKNEELDLRYRLLKVDVATEVELSKHQVRSFRDAVLSSVSNLLKPHHQGFGGGGNGQGGGGGNDNLRWSGPKGRR